MKYEGTVAVNPTSLEAGVMAQQFADRATTCGYDSCNEPAVGCAVHESTIPNPKDNARNTRNHDETFGSTFLAVCARHKAWEFEKINPVNTGAWSDVWM